MIKKAIDRKAKAKVNKIILKLAAENGVDLASHMTPNIQVRLDDLLQSIIDDVGYIELAKMGLK